MAIEVRQYFPTPIVLADLPDAEALNKDLKATILARAETEASTQHSNLGGWQSNWDMDDWGGDASKTLMDFACKLANRLTADRSGKKAQVKWRYNVWANVNRSGQANEFHYHPGCFWSGTYYVDDGGVGGDPNLGGAFEMQDPRGVAPAMYAPTLCFASPGAQSMGASELIQPKAGLMVLFPSWLSHAVRPYYGTATRISIAFNLSV